MKRLLIAFCLIATIVLAWKNPRTVDRIVHMFTGSPEVRAVTPEPTQSAATPTDQQVAKKSASVRKRVKAAAVVPEAAPIESVEVLPVKEAPIPKKIPTQATVKPDSTAVHSFNSSRSPVVYLLKKGDRVDSSLEVIDYQGRWSLVHTDSNQFGFVRSETLERPQMAASRD